MVTDLTALINIVYDHQRGINWRDKGERPKHFEKIVNECPSRALLPPSRRRRGNQVPIIFLSSQLLS